MLESPAPRGEALPRGPGTYVLALHLSEGVDAVVGALGPVALPAGYYTYVGSALGGLGARVARHLRATRRRRWHVDYLLDVARVVEVWYALGEERLECAWAREIAAGGLTPWAPGFGASDCRCPTHLLYSPARPEPLPGLVVVRLR